MPAISFEQGVALAYGVYIDPKDNTQNQTFTLVEENSARNVNGKFAINIQNSQVSNRLRALFHATTATNAGALNFAVNSAGTLLNNLNSQIYTRATTSTAITDINLTDPGQDIYTGFNASQKQLDFRAGGDIVGNNNVTVVERNYHLTGMSIWKKLKK